MGRQPGGEGMQGKGEEAEFRQFVNELFGEVPISRMGPRVRWEVGGYGNATQDVV